MKRNTGMTRNTVVALLALALVAGCQNDVAGPDAVKAGSPALQVTVNPADGTGFVGKGDVQLIFGWNNKALQDNAGSVEFRANSTVVTETTLDLHQLEQRKYPGAHFPRAPGCLQERR